MDIMEFITIYSSQVRKKTIELIKKLEDQLIVTKLDNVGDLKNILSDFVLSGKLIRGSLYLLISQVYGHRRIEDLLNIAVAIEINHSGLLIHDDIMDNDLFRRSKPSMHKRYGLFAPDLGITDAEDFGNNMAICMGDICFFASNYFIEQSSIPSDIKQRISNYYYLQILKAGLSQMSDVKFGLSSKEPKLSEILKIYKYKTADYTFNSPFVMGYFSSGQKDNKEVTLLENIGHSLGMIFQISDDLIGFLKDTETIGKDVGSDIRENKKTIIRHFMIKNLRSADLDFAIQCFGNKELKYADLEKLRDIYYTRKIDISINKYITNEENSARTNIAKLHVTEENKNILVQFADYIINRTK